MRDLREKCWQLCFRSRLVRKENKPGHLGFTVCVVQVGFELLAVGLPSSASQMLTWLVSFLTLFHGWKESEVLFVTWSLYKIQISLAVELHGNTLHLFAHICVWSFLFSLSRMGTTAGHLHTGSYLLLLHVHNICWWAQSHSQIGGIRGDP